MPVTWRRGLRRAVGGTLNVVAARLMNSGRRRVPLVPMSIEDYRALATPTPRDMALLLAGRSNRERARVLEAALRAGGCRSRGNRIERSRGRG